MAGPGPPAPARRRRLDTLRVDDLLAICVRIPYTSHDSLRCVCRRLRTVAERSALARHRVAAGWGESALVVAGGGNTVYDHLDDDPEPERPETWGLVGGRWRSLRRQPAPRCDCGVVCVGREMVCAGGTITTWDEATEAWIMTTGISDVVAYDPWGDAWRDVDVDVRAGDVQAGGDDGGAARPRGAARAGLDARTSGACCVDPVRGDLVVLGGWRVVDRHQFRDAAVASAQASPLDGRVILAAPGGAEAPPRAGAGARAGGGSFGTSRLAWASLPPLPHAVSNFAAAVLGDKLYVAGGLRWEDEGRQRSPSDALQVFCFTDRTWRLGPPLPAPQYYGDGASFGGKLYVVGGKNRDRKLSDVVVVFDPETGGWARGPALPGARYYHSALVHDDRLVVFGGQGPPLFYDDADRNNPKWTHDPAVVPPLPEGYDHPLLAPMVCSVPVG